MSETFPVEESQVDPLLVEDQSYYERVLFHVNFFDDKNFSAEISRGLPQPLYDRALRIIKDCPERRYSRPLGDIWLIPHHVRNTDYLRAIDDKFVSFSPEAKMVLEVEGLRDQVDAIREKRRLEYIWENKVPELDYQFRTTPYRHQVAALASIHGTAAAALFMEMGTGKSKVIVDEMGWRVHERQKKAAELGRAIIPLRVLVVCPKIVRYTWVGNCEDFFGELSKHLPEDIPFFATKLISSAKPDKVSAQLAAPNRLPKIPHLHVYSASYETVARNTELLMIMPWDMIVLDESQRIKTPSSKRTRAILKFMQFCREEYMSQRLILTGTPVLNTLWDLWAQFEALDTAALGYSNFNQFKKEFDIEGGSMGRSKGELQRDFTKVEQLQSAMTRYAFVVRKEECLDLPEVTHQDIIFDLTTQQQEAYASMEAWFFASVEAEEQEREKSERLAAEKAEAEALGIEFDKSEYEHKTFRSEATSVLSRMVKFAQITSGYIKDEHGHEVDIPGGNPKLETMMEKISELPSSDRFVIWSRFKKDRANMSAALQKAGYKYAIMDGSTPEPEVTKILSSFNSDDSGNGIQVIIGDPSSAGEGVDMLGTKNNPCRTVFYYSADFSLGKRLQSEARVHRSGQTHNVTYYHLIANGTIDAYVEEKLANKRDLADEVKDLKGAKEAIIAIKEARLKSLVSETDE